MKKLVFVAVILTAFVFETRAYHYEGLGGYWDEPFFRRKTVSNIWATSIDYRVEAHGNTHYPKMFSFARLRVYSSPYDPIATYYAYSKTDNWVSEEGTCTAPSGLYVYKVIMEVSAEEYWDYDPYPMKYTAPARIEISY